MTQDETGNINLDSSASGSSEINLLDQLRETQANQKQPSPTDVDIDDDLEVDDSATESSNSSESDFENGKLTPQARRALVSLLKHGVVLAAQKGKLFEFICRYQSGIRSHLSDVYLKLVLDERMGVAFISQVEESENEDTDVVSLITRRTLSLYDTLLLLVLRKHYQERESAGEQRIIIDIERIEANLMPFLPLTNSMKSDRRKLIVALNKMLEKRLLTKVRGSNDRLEITPIIRYVVNAAFLEKMLDEYQILAGEAVVDIKQSKDSDE